MKVFVFALIFVLFLSSCSQDLNIIKFKTKDSTIVEGNKTYLEWEVENADSIVLKQQGFDDPILESAPLKSRMLVTPSFSSEYFLKAFKDEQYQRKSCSLTVIRSSQRVDTVFIVKPTVTPEPNDSKSKYIKGLQTIENVKKSSKINYEIFYVDKHNYPNEIKLYVYVRDENGNLIANLAPPYGTNKNKDKYFQKLIEEIEGEINNIEYFDVEERHDTLAQKYNFSLVLDHSGSMSYDINNLHESVKGFINKTNKVDSISIVKFDNFVDLSVPITNNKSALLDQQLYNGLNNFGGATALIAAGDEGLRSIKNCKNTKIEILFTDGYENFSLINAIYSGKGYNYKPSQLINQAREWNTRIFTIGFGNSDSTLLQKISLLTDGSYYYVKNGDEIDEVFNELPRIFQNYYIISYKPIKKEGEHKINLIYTNPDGSTNFANRSTYIGNVDLADLSYISRQSIAYFEFRSDQLRDQDKIVLKNIATFLKNNKISTIEIHGHTDLSGTKEFNIELSRRRAEVVAKEFIDLGVPKSSITIVPHGMEEPIWNPEFDEYQKYDNRRVEFIFKE